MFWLPFGTAAAVIGLALMTIGVTRLSPSGNLFGSVWFDGGLGILALGAVLLLWSLWLFLNRRRGVNTAIETKPRAGDDWKGDAVRGYYR